MIINHNMSAINIYNNMNKISSGLRINSASDDSPYRGPALYQNGEYAYHCKTEGSFEFYQVYEEILYGGKKIYECIFNGGILR